MLERACGMRKVCPPLSCAFARDEQSSPDKRTHFVLNKVTYHAAALLRYCIQFEKGSASCFSYAYVCCKNAAWGAEAPAGV